MKKMILIINGPSLNLLNTRQPEIYGYQSLQDVESSCASLAIAGFGVQGYEFAIRRLAKVFV